nr:olfactory receptor 8S1-like [Loxodonta africana]
MALRNHSTITEFILLGLSADPKIQALLFVLFLRIYLLTMLGNLMMSLVIRADSHLYSPMYFFLSHFSFIDLCFSSVTLSKMLENFLSQKKTISVRSSVAQIFFVFITGGTEICLLSVMTYDCYAAICHPLLYGQMMSKQRCVQLVWGSWGLGFLGTVINVPLAMKMDFCDTYNIPLYSCELPSIFLLPCSDVSTNFLVILCSTIPHALIIILSIFFSYICIIFTILSITSTSGRSKTFSSCSSHLIAVIFFYGSVFLQYFMPPQARPFR